MTYKFAKKILEKLNQTWWHPINLKSGQNYSVEILAHIEKMRQKEIQEIEPFDFWQDLDETE